ncbi:MAG TPA: methyltransferase domain-containing protein [Flavobacteriia bacterium]|nr:methyltransferase domain-containing protein [Flavobacteriia bacterium]
MPFKFKQFTIRQDNCAMKIGTDGVLLGAWVAVENQPKSILDIGTGTGIIALQLAQRSTAEIIDALEIEGKAYEQAVENFENSQWGDRLFCYHASLQEFTLEVDEKYSLIVSNPPFYSDNFETAIKERNTARFTSALPFDELLNSASKLLHNKGYFSTIIPFKEEQYFIELASKVHLFPSRICRVKGTPTTDIKRSLLEFCFRKEEIKYTELTIEIQRHQYTKAYITLVQDFYLKM